MSIRLTQQYITVGGPVTSGLLRVTRQYVGALYGSTTGELRVTRQYVNVLYKGFTAVSAENTLNLTDQVGRVKPAEASNTLNFTDNLLRPNPASALNLLVLIDTLLGFNFVQDRQVPTNVLSLTQTAEAVGFEDTTSTLNLSHDVDVRGPIQVLAESLVWFTNTPRSLNKYVYADTTLLLSGRGVVPIDLTVEDWIDFYGLGRMTFIDDTLAFTHSAEHAKGIGVEIQYLNISDTVHVRGTFRLPVSTDLGVGHSLTYFEDTPCNRKSYSPFSGDNTSTDLQMPTIITMPQYSGDDRFSVYYPSRGGRSSEVVLRAPEFGNIHRTKHSRVNRESRGGELIVFSDPDWPTVKTVQITITGLTKDTIDDLQDFMADHLGQIIGFTDWEGYEWEGIIKNPNDPATNDGKEKWTVSLTFEGDKLEGYSPGNLLNTADAAEAGKDPGANTDLGITDEAGGAWRDGIQGNGLSLIHNASGVIV